MNIPEYPVSFEGPFQRNPWVWASATAVDGTVNPWLGAPLGSQFTLITAGSVALYIKKAVVGETADWKAVTTAA